MDDARWDQTLQCLGDRTQMEKSKPIIHEIMRKAVDDANGEGISTIVLLSMLWDLCNKGLILNGMPLDMLECLFKDFVTGKKKN